MKTGSLCVSIAALAFCGCATVLTNELQQPSEPEVQACVPLNITAVSYLPYHQLPEVEAPTAATYRKDPALKQEVADALQRFGCADADVVWIEMNAEEIIFADDAISTAGVGPSNLGSKTDPKSYDKKFREFMRSTAQASGRPWLLVQRESEEISAHGLGLYNGLIWIATLGLFPMIGHLDRRLHVPFMASNVTNPSLKSVATNSAGVWMGTLFYLSNHQQPTEAINGFNVRTNDRLAEEVQRPARQKASVK